MNQIKRDVYILSDKLKDPIDYVQNTNAIPIIFTMRDYDIPSGATAQIFVSKPSGKSVYNAAEISDNIITVNVTTQMFSEVGVSALQIQISNAEKNLVTFEYPVHVHRNKTDPNAAESENESSFFDELRDAANAANQAADNANDTAQSIQQAADDGDFSSTITIGNTTTGEPGTQAEVTNTGTAKDPVFNFIIPQGPVGPRGPAGNINDIEDATVTFSQASSRTNINSGDSIGTLFGKIRKWFADLGTAAFQGVSNALTQTTSGYVLDARQGKTLADRIGTLSSLLTTAKTSLVNAVNELFNNIGDLADLDTTEKTNVVGAINEINADLSDGIKIVDILECTVQYSGTIGAGSQNTCTGTITSDKKISDCKFIGLFVCSNYGIPVDEPTFTPRGDNSVTVQQVVRNYTDVAHTVVTTMIVICYK